MSEAIIDLYARINERGRLVSDRAHRLEFETTMHLLSPHIEHHGARCLDILDVGSGSGRYAIALARAGHRVTATDIVPAHLEAIADLARAEGLAPEIVGLSAASSGAGLDAGAKTGLRIACADALDLSAWPDAAFDLVLCLGPYYHLRTRALRDRCLAEARRVLRADGILALAWINRNFALAWYTAHGIFFDSNMLESLSARDYTFVSGIDAFLDNAWFCAPEDALAELRAGGFEPFLAACTDGIDAFFARQLESMSAAEWDAWRTRHFATCIDPACIGAGNHGLALARRL